MMDKTWTSLEALPEGFLGPIKNKPILIGNKLICASSTENDGWQVHMEFTEDRGKTWRKTSPINSKPWNIIQPSILTLNNNVLQIVCRSQNEHIISAFSDEGETWSDPIALYLPNNNSGTDAVTLKDGRQLMVYNHVAASESAYKDKSSYSAECRSIWRWNYLESITHSRRLANKGIFLPIGYTRGRRYDTHSIHVAQRKN